MTFLDTILTAGLVLLALLFLGVVFGRFILAKKPAAPCGGACSCAKLRAVPASANAAELTPPPRG